MSQKTEIINLIKSNDEVFKNAFLERKASDEDIKNAEDTLGFKIPESYVWYLKEIDMVVSFLNSWVWG